MKTIIQRGAEAVISLEKSGEGAKIIKERVIKGYRLPELDVKIRKQRTRHEESLMEKARRAGVNVPRVLEKTDFSLIMEYVDGQKVKDILDISGDRLNIISEAGRSVAKLHSYDIIHGDLTTSNMIRKGDKVFFIDFGLGKVSGRVEDKAVDLLLLNEALRSVHFQHAESLWSAFLESYSRDYTDAKAVIKRLEKIDKRRRYKGGD